MVFQLSFPQECPTKRDWDKSFNFRHNYAATGNKLRVPLGQWTHPTHRKWIWYTSPTDDLHRIEDGFIYHYLPSQSICRTRSGLAYTLTWKEQLRGNHVMAQPVSVQGSHKTHSNKLNIGPTLARGPQQPSDFWDFLRTWGGEWMWEGIEDGQATKHNLSWLVQGMESNTLLWVTDSSYDRKRTPTVLSGGGWIIFCQTTSKRLVGFFWENSPLASSYRAKLLGLCLLHIFAWALS
jgi:hypothetical protein